jgi:uncharacterized cupredoxin-like copper-binding protein
MDRVKRVIMLVAASMGLVLLAAACGSSESATLDAPEVSGVSASDVMVMDIHDESEDGHEGDAALAHDEDGHDGMTAENGVVKITLNAVEGRPSRFEPGVVEVSVGERVELTLINGGRAEHDVEVAGLAAGAIEKVGGGSSHGSHDAEIVSAHAAPGTEAAVMFTPTEAGEYEFYCTLPGHKEAGMIGKLIVGPPMVARASTN